MGWRKKKHPMKTIHTLTLMAAALTAGAAAAQASTIFNFDADTFGTSTTFTDTANGLSATFTSSGDPGGFAVGPSIFDTLTGNVLADPGPAFLQNLTLTVDFSANLSAIDLLFATGDFGPASPFTLTAYEGNTLVGSATSTGVVLTTFPEGEIAFSGPGFNTVVLSSAAPTFAIDNVQVSQTPEPGSAGMFLLAGTILGGVSIIGRRRGRSNRAARCS